MIIDDLFEEPQLCPECGGISLSDLILAEKKDACYYKVKASAKVWPSAYASGRLVQCRKKGADSYGNKSEGVAEGSEQPVSFREMVNTVDEHYPKYYAELSGSDISDKQFERAIVNAYKAIVKKQGVAEEYELAGVGVAYELGRRAYKQGMTIRDNPYSATKEARKNDEWAKGLERGQHDANDARHFRSSVREQGVAEGQLDEKSTSKAQFRTMAAAAHNPKFAKKVGISQDVAREFNKADKGQDYKKLPARTTEESERGRGRPTTGEWDPTSGKVGRIEKTLTGIRHHADPSRYGGTEPDPEFDTLNKNTINAMDRALGVKWDRESKKYFSPLKVDMDEGEQQKGADYRDPPEADYGDDYQDMVARVKKLAGLGPLKTVYDPNKRVYRNMPTSVQPKK